MLESLKGKSWWCVSLNGSAMQPVTEAGGPPSKVDPLNCQGLERNTYPTPGGGNLAFSPPFFLRTRLYGPFRLAR